LAHGAFAHGPADEAARGAGVGDDLGGDGGEGAHRVAEGLVLADQAGEVEADLDRHVGRAGQVQGHVVADPPPRLPGQGEVEGGHYTDPAPRTPSTEKGDVHVSTGLTLGDEPTTDPRVAREEHARSTQRIVATPVLTTVGSGASVVNPRI